MNYWSSYSGLQLDLLNIKEHHILSPDSPPTLHICLLCIRSDFWVITFTFIFPSLALFTCAPYLIGAKKIFYCMHIHPDDCNHISLLIQLIKLKSNCEAWTFKGWFDANLLFYYIDFFLQNCNEVNASVFDCLYFVGVYFT